MKKFLAIFAIAAVFAACNNESESTSADETRVADSLRQDSINKANEAAAAAAAAAADTVKKDTMMKVDSVKK